jgi:chromosome segregation ATPase
VQEAVEGCAQLMITSQSKNIEYSLVTSIFKRLNDGLMDSEEILADFRRKMQQRKDEMAALERELRRLTDRLKGEMAPADDDEYAEISGLEVVGETTAEKMDDVSAYQCTWVSLTDVLNERLHAPLDFHQARQRIENLAHQLRQTRENNEVLERYARVQAQLQEAEAQLVDLQGRLNNARGEMQEASTAADSLMTTRGHAHNRVLRASTSAPHAIHGRCDDLGQQAQH